MEGGPRGWKEDKEGGRRTKRVEGGQRGPVEGEQREWKEDREGGRTETEVERDDSYLPVKDHLQQKPGDGPKGRLTWRYL